MSAVSFQNLFSTILPGHILYMKCLYGHSHGRTCKSQLVNKSRRTEADFHLKNKLNAPLNLKKFETLLYALSLEIHLFKLLKSVKGGGGGMYFRPPCYGYALNYIFVSLVIPGTRPLFK